MDDINVEEWANTVVDRWHDEVNEEAMMNLDPEYLARLGDRAKVTRLYANYMKKHIATAITEVVEAERERLIAGLAEVYKTHPVAIASLCDDYFDKSGFLLGKVRIEARALEPKKEKT